MRNIPRIKIRFKVYYAGHTFNSEKPNRSPVTWTTLYLSYPKSVTNPGSRMGDGWGGMGGEWVGDGWGEFS